VESASLLLGFRGTALGWIPHLDSRHFEAVTAEADGLGRDLRTFSTLARKVVRVLARCCQRHLLRRQDVQAQRVPGRERALRIPFAFA
jgi:hypothetical protein